MSCLQQLDTPHSQPPHHFAPTTHLHLDNSQQVRGPRLQVHPHFHLPSAIPHVFKKRGHSFQLLLRRPATFHLRHNPQIVFTCRLERYLVRHPRGIASLTVRTLRRENTFREGCSSGFDRRRICRLSRNTCSLVIRD